MVGPGPADHQWDSLVSFSRIRTSVRFVLAIVNNLQIQTVPFRLFRDIKPHNFVLTPVANVLLIDFGSAAPLLPCLVPCGTCDYISPEILLAHENALLALEMNDASASPCLFEGWSRRLRCRNGLVEFGGDVL